MRQALLPLWLLVALAGTVFAQHEVTVERQADGRAIAFSARSGACTIQWQLLLSEPNRGVIRHHPDCSLPPGEQVRLIASLIAAALRDSSSAVPFHTLSWGRLSPDGAHDDTLARRLALAAARSPGWDKLRGAPRRGDVNGFVRGLANDALIYEELRNVFLAASLQLRMSAVEKVLVLRARDLPFGSRLRERGVKPEDKLPFDCQAWFSVARLPDRKP